MKAKLSEIWLVSTGQDSMLENIELIKKYDEYYPKLKLRLGIGFHPELLVPGGEDFDLKLFRMDGQTLRTHVVETFEKVTQVAEDKGGNLDFIGEIGLDDFWLEKGLADKKVMQRDYEKSMHLQNEMFQAQLEYGLERSLPLSIHSRGAESKCLLALRQQKKQFPKLNAILHSFTGSEDQMNEAVNMGLYIGVNGIVTYSSSEEIRKFVRSKVAGTNNTMKLRSLYASNIILETDCPFLVPSNAYFEDLKKVYGDKVNEPAQVMNVLDAI
jgi:Tat protein secretion system quality control protein TatD with DNase activity